MQTQTDIGLSDGIALRCKSGRSPMQGSCVTFCATQRVEAQVDVGLIAGSFYRRLIPSA
jgi:hypothetical protein